MHFGMGAWNHLCRGTEIWDVPLDCRLIFLSCSFPFHPPSASKKENPLVVLIFFFGWKTRGCQGPL